MIRSQIVQLQLILFTLWCLSSCSFMRKGESKSPVGIVYGRQDFKDNNKENGNTFELNLELDVSHKKSEKCAGISTDPELERKVFDMEKKIKYLEGQVEEIENLKKIVKYLKGQVEEI